MARNQKSVRQELASNWSWWVEKYFRMCGISSYPSRSIQSYNHRYIHWHFIIHTTTPSILGSGGGRRLDVGDDDLWLREAGAPRGLKEPCCWHAQGQPRRWLVLGPCLSLLFPWLACLVDENVWFRHRWNYTLSHPNRARSATGTLHPLSSCLVPCVG